MTCGVSSIAIFLNPTVTYSSRPSHKLHSNFSAPLHVQCKSSDAERSLTTTELLQNGASVTGGAFDFEKATISLTSKTISTTKKVTIVRHGLSTWNQEKRVQGSSNLSVLTEAGVQQAERCKEALANIYFHKCFSSPISRAKVILAKIKPRFSDCCPLCILTLFVQSTAEIIWEGRDEPLVFLDSLMEAHLFYLEGMKNEDAMQMHPKEYRLWREDPASFNVKGIYPIRNLWGTARDAWKEILLSPGENFLVITHKSILRALVCTALGLGPERFRATDINNGGISVFSFNKNGEAMLQSLNMTAHMYGDHVYHY